MFNYEWVRLNKKKIGNANANKVQQKIYKSLSTN